MDLKVRTHFEFDEFITSVEVHEEGLEAGVDSRGIGAELNVEEDVAEEVVDDIFMKNVKF